MVDQNEFSIMIHHNNFNIILKFDIMLKHLKFIKILKFRFNSIL